MLCIKDSPLCLKLVALSKAVVDTVAAQGQAMVEAVVVPGQAMVEAMVDTVAVQGQAMVEALPAIMVKARLAISHPTRTLDTLRLTLPVHVSDIRETLLHIEGTMIMQTIGNVCVCVCDSPVMIALSLSHTQPFYASNMQTPFSANRYADKLTSIAVYLLAMTFFSIVHAITMCDCDSLLSHTHSYNSGRKYHSNQTKFLGSLPETSGGSGGSSSSRPVVYSDGCCYNNGFRGACGGVGVYWGHGSSQ